MTTLPLPMSVLTCRWLPYQSNGKGPRLPIALGFQVQPSGRRKKSLKPPVGDQISVDSELFKRWIVNWEVLDLQKCSTILNWIVLSRPQPTGLSPTKRLPAPHWRAKAALFSTLSGRSWEALLRDNVAQWPQSEANPPTHPAAVYLFSFQ